LSKTIYDIAKAGNISPATVSLALRDSAVVSEKTKLKVKALAKELNYTPNTIARSLVLNKTNIIGVVAQDISHPYMADIINGIQEEAAKHGYLVLFNSISYENDTSLKALVERRVDGLIILPITRISDDIKRLSGTGFPLVLISRHLPGVETDYVVCDNTRGACEMTNHLVKIGHKNIAYIAYSSGDTTSDDRIAGYKKALEENGLPFKEELFFNVRGEDSNTGAVLSAILGMNEKPTAIFASGDTFAIRIMHELRQRKIRIPEDIAVVGFNNLSFSATTYPPLTTVDHFGNKMGAQAITLLIDRLKNPGSSPQHVIIEPKLIIRESCGVNLKK